jgi:hypothetical protein
LAEEEAKDLATGKDFTLDDRVSPSILIALGLDLEAEQYVFCLYHFYILTICLRRSLATAAKQVWEHAQDRQRTKFQLRSNALQRKIESWCRFQLLYCPAVATLHAPSPNDNSASSIKPHLIPLWLPSQINGRVSVDTSLTDIEWKLRHAQAYESLDSLRHFLQFRAYLYKFKDRFVRGQGANTRARNAINVVQAKIDAAAAEYRVAYGALLSLSSQVFDFSWKNELLQLKDEDIRDLSEGKEDRRGKTQSEGRRTVSWIWKTVPADDLENDAFLRESMFMFSLMLFRC